MTQYEEDDTYTLEIMSDVTNWGGVLLDNEILNHLEIEDTVRVIFESYGQPRYVTITDILPDGYFKGYIDDPYNHRRCNICRSGEMIKGNPLYRCENSNCNKDFDCHLKCLEEHPYMVCGCDRNKFKLVKWEQFLLNGSTIIFKKNNISEIPDWSKNTERLIEIYKNKENKGYRITGLR